MPGQILAGLAAGALPIFGAQASAQIQRKWALRDLENQNFYNSPAEQLRRLKEAGLPAAAFFSGGVSSQSDQPRSSSVDPTLGVSQGVSSYLNSRMNSAQLRLMDAQTRKADAEAGEAEGRTAVLKSPMDNFAGGINTHQGVLMSTQLDRQQADAAGANAAQMIQQQIAKAGEGDILGALRRGDLDHILTNNELLRQTFADNQQFLEFKRKLANRLEAKGEEGSILHILEELLGAALFSSLRMKR